MTTQRGAMWRLGEYLGLVTDKPKPRVGSSGWWRAVLLIAFVSTVAVAVVNRL